jgi:hypothetical protein
MGFEPTTSSMRPKRSTSRSTPHYLRRCCHKARRGGASCHTRATPDESGVVGVAIDEVEVVLVDGDAPQLDGVVIGEHGVDDERWEHRNGVRHREPDAAERFGLALEVAGEQLLDRTQDPFGEQLERRPAIGRAARGEQTLGFIEEVRRTADPPTPALRAQDRPICSASAAAWRFTAGVRTGWRR